MLQSKNGIVLLRGFNALYQGAKPEIRPSIPFQQNAVTHLRRLDFKDLTKQVALNWARLL